MTVADKLILGLNTTMNGIGIVFIVLIVLWAIIVVESNLISFFSERFKKPESVDLSVNVDKVDIERKGVTDDEIQAVIMAVVSNYADIPLSRLQFKSIKAL
jgi:oxaloacetate decarboxylase gamma subunit